MVGTKRRHEDDNTDLDETPRKLRAQVLEDDTDGQETAEAQTPSRKARQQLPDVGTPRSILKKPGLTNGAYAATPKSTRKLLFETPTKSVATQTAAHDGKATDKYSNTLQMAWIAMTRSWTRRIPWQSSF
jgi:origin recognition complex subunit 2